MSGTTLAAVLAIYLLGGTVLEGVAFPLLVGIVAGTCFAVFVAAPVSALLARCVVMPPPAAAWRRCADRL